MKKSLARLTLISGATTALLVMRVDAQDVSFLETNPAIEGALPSGPELVPVQSALQPTVGETPFVRPINFRSSPDLRASNYRGSADLRENVEGKQYVPSERHWKLLFGVTVGGNYDDNIFLAPNGLKQHDFIFAIAPTLGIQFGDPASGINFLTLTYMPTFLLFADHSDQNSIDQTVNLKFQRQTEIWTLATDFGFYAMNGGNDPLQTAGGINVGEPVGERVSRQVFLLGVDYKYSLSDKTSLDIGLAGNYTHSETLLSTANVVNQNYITYAITGRTSIGLGFGIGYANTEGSPNQVYEQALVSVRYIATSKLNFELRGGAEFLQTGGGGGDQINGVFGATATYAYSDRTSVSLSGYRNVNPSSTQANSDFIATGVQVSASHKFPGRLQVTLKAGYENAEYFTYTGPAASPLTNNYFYVQPSVQYLLGENCAISLFYEYRINNSTSAQSQFSDNRMGLSFSFAF